MSTLILPTLPSSALMVFNAAFDRIDAYGYVDEEGSPPSGMTLLRRRCQMDRRSVQRGLSVLESADLITRIRRGRAPMLLRLHVERLGLTDSCATCGKPVEKSGNWCPRCKQRFGRDDRHWTIKCMDLWLKGKTPMSIAVELNIPLLQPRADDGRSDGGAAVVPFLVNHPELAHWPEREAWMQRMREIERGSGIEE